MSASGVICEEAAFCPTGKAVIGSNGALGAVLRVGADLKVLRLDLEDFGSDFARCDLPQRDHSGFVLVTFHLR